MPILFTAMEKQHLTYFKIENFKRFDSFEMSNLGQFNLIVGDNNVGKTSVLEALLFDNVGVATANNLLSAEFMRLGGTDTDSKYKVLSLQDAWIRVFKNINRPILFSSTSGTEKSAPLAISYRKTSSAEIEQALLDQKAAIPKARIEFDAPHPLASVIPAYFEGLENVMNHVKFVPLSRANHLYDGTLVRIFYDHFNNDSLTRNQFVEALKLLLPTIHEVRVHRVNNGYEYLGIEQKGHNTISPLTQFGDGLVKLARNIMEIIVTQGKRLMVDEIGSGIHFTRLVDYWKTIIRLCRQYDVQLFATTHSLECQQAFVDALEAPDMQELQKEARNISLIENKDGEVKAVTYTFDQLEFSLENGIETRGGKRKANQVWK